MKPQFRVKEHGNAYVPQQRVLWWWHNISGGVGSIDAARRIIYEKTAGSRAMGVAQTGFTRQEK